MRALEVFAGFVAHANFWFGLVYSAIPLDFGSLTSDRVPNPAHADALTACAQGVTKNCRRRAGDLGTALSAAAALGVADGLAATTEVVDANVRTPARKPPQSRSKWRRWPQSQGGRYTGRNLRFARRR